jgi:hypothetical protein
MDSYGIECCNCGSTVNFPDTKAASPEEHRKYISKRPHSFWVGTPSGETRALCYPCSWNPLVKEKYPKRTEDTKNQKKTFGLIKWVVFIYIISAVLGGALSMNDSSDVSEPSSGYEQEWNADNSLEGSGGNFDSQSKP